jgi:GAF domain-containing protein
MIVPNSPPAPLDERVRLNVLRDSGVLDTGREPAFDRIVERAAEAADCPIALVSLIDAHRQWFKAAVGLDVRETPRQQAFCAHAILDEAVMLVPDALADPRFSANPLVLDAPHIRAYAGAPISSLAGARLGTVCVIDTKPRSFSPELAVTLRGLADEVSVLLAERFARRALAFVNPVPVA